MSGLVASAMFFAARHEFGGQYHRAILTGLANRALLHGRLRQGLAQARRRCAGIGIAVFPSGATEPEPLQEKSDQEMCVDRRGRKGPAGA